MQPTIAVDDVHIAVAFRADERFAGLAAKLEIEQHAFVDRILGIEIVRPELIEPTRFPAVGIARNRVHPSDVPGPVVFEPDLVPATGKLVSGCLRDTAFDVHPSALEGAHPRTVRPRTRPACNRAGS